MSEHRFIEVERLIEEYDIPEFERRQAVFEAMGIAPALAVIVAGEDKGSLSYMKGIRRFCAAHNIRFAGISVGSGAEMADAIQRLNKDDETDGIMVMYPTPFEEKDTYFMNLVTPEKDVEGLHNSHLGFLVQFEKFRDISGLKKLVVPPTAKGILYIFKRYRELYDSYYKTNGSYPDGLDSNPFVIEGSRFTVINDSPAVGRSLALMLLNENGSVRLCHKYTPREEILRLCGNSDVVISAVPGGGFVIPTPRIKEGSIIIDISFEGNFEYPSVLEKAYMTAPRWDLMQKGNRINDMTLYRLLSNLFYLIDSGLPPDVLRKMNAGF